MYSESHDPFVYLEDLSSEQTQNFARLSHDATRWRFCSDTAFTALKDDITAALRDKRQIPFCQEHRAKMYHFYQSEAYPKGVYRVCSAASYRAGMPDWQILFHVADFDALLGDDVYLDGVSHYVEQPQRVLLSLSAGGGDAAYTLEFDLAAGALVSGGFHFPLGKNHIAWRDADSVWVCPAWDERQLTASGYPREVWLLRRGQDFSEAQPVYQMAEEGVMVNAWRYLDAQGAPIDLIEAATGFFSKQYFQVTEQGETRHLDVPQDAEVVGYLAGQLLLHLKSDWQRANHIYRSGSLLAVKLSRGVVGAVHCLFEPSPTQALESVETTRRFVVASLLDNVAGSLKAWRWDGQSWVVQDLPALPDDAGVWEMTDQPWGGDTVYLAGSSFTVPLTLFALDLSVMELSVLRRQPPRFNADGISVQQLHALSADGTAVPYYHIGRNRSPDTPTLVYVYGGFGVPELPHYLGSIGRHWLESGYAFVLANVRGGGEFAHWHQAAQRQNKHKSVDDLLAVVADLHRRAWTSPAKTALQGGSNGGLVSASAYVRAPQSVGALVCEVPLTDMLAYTRLSAGASWIEEYGNPDIPEEHAYLAELSPYHQLDSTKAYPPALITTSLSDDRVHPAHALKFYAKLHEICPEHTCLYAPADGGHTGNGTQEQTAEELACVLRFLHETVAA